MKHLRTFLCLAALCVASAASAQTLKVYTGQVAIAFPATATGDMKYVGSALTIGSDDIRLSNSRLYHGWIAQSSFLPVSVRTYDDAWSPRYDSGRCGSTS